MRKEAIPVNGLSDCGCGHAHATREIDGQFTDYRCSNCQELLLSQAIHAEV